MFISILQENSLPFITTYNVQLNVGAVNTFSSPITVPPLAPPKAPQITSVALAVQANQQQPEITITGSGFLTGPDGQTADVSQVKVNFTQANGTVFPANLDLTADNTDKSLTVLVPPGAVLGISQITVLRPDPVDTPVHGSPNGSLPSTQMTASNPAQFNPNGSYVFVALSEGDNGVGALAVIDGNSADNGSTTTNPDGSTTTNPNTFGQVVADIPLGATGQVTFPRDVAITPDNSRAYVTLEQSGQVALVDTITLQQVNVHASNLNAMAAPPSPLPIAAPGGVALDPSLMDAAITGPTPIRGTVTAIPGLDHWDLELGAWVAGWQPIGAPLATGNGPVSSGLLMTLDPVGEKIANGAYVLRLTAYNSSDMPLLYDDTYIDVYANPRNVDIDLPLGAEPYGIAIDPSGNYAYVADDRPYAVSADYVPPPGQPAPPAGAQCSQVYVIDINPASPNYNQVVDTIQLVDSDPLSDGSLPQVAGQPNLGSKNSLIAPTGLVDITVTPNSEQIDVAAPNYFPTGAEFTVANGNLIQINLTPSDGISLASQTGTTVTITTADPLDVAVGQQVTIAGITGSGTGTGTSTATNSATATGTNAGIGTASTTYNGTFTITAVTSSTTFQYTAAAGLGTASLSSATATFAGFALNEATGIVATPAAQDTFGVAAEPQAAAQTTATQTGQAQTGQAQTGQATAQPLQYDIAFTNGNSDGAGVEVLNPTTPQPTIVPLDVNTYNYQSYLQPHNANGIVFAQDSSGTWYALVAGRADQVFSSSGGGVVGDSIIASADSDYLDQDQDPLFEDGDVAIIANPFGTNPQVVATTRPIPYGYPVDLALSPPQVTTPGTTSSQYLYVSYQGLASTASYGAGAVFIFNATAMLTEVTTLLQTNRGKSLLALFPVDDIVIPPGGTVPAALVRTPNTTIDVMADYRSNYLPTDPKNPVDPAALVFGVYENANGPIALGDLPGGIAIESAPAPQLAVTVPTPIQITTTVDRINQTVSTSGGEFDFSINVAAKVTLSIEDAITDDPVTSESIPDPTDPTGPLLSLEDFADPVDGLSVPAAGTYKTSLAILGTYEQPGTYNFTLTATNTAGQTSTVTGEIILSLQENETLPVGHTIIEGVDIWDGHLTVSSDDVTIPGPGLDLDFTRTYSSAGNVSAGPLGAGWTDSYNVKLVQNNGTYTIIGGDGSGNTFSTAGATNATLAQEFGLPSSDWATALFYQPQVGYHSTLVQISQTELYFYTTDHTLYDFVLQPGLSGSGTVYTLRYIQDSDGNRIDLYYNDDLTDTRLALTDPSAPGYLSPALQADLTGPPLTLGIVKDSANRALLLSYQFIFNDNRIVKITGYDADPSDSGGNLLGLDIDYAYDQWGNLTSVTRVDSSGAVLRKEAYTYTPGNGITGHNLLTYIEPNGFDAAGNPVANAADFTTTYTYRGYDGVDANGNPIGSAFTNGVYNGGYSLTIPNFSSFFGVPLFEMVQSVSEPGGATGSTTPFSVINFTYNISTDPTVPNTRVVTDPRGRGRPADDLHAGRLRRHHRNQRPERHRPARFE